MASIPLSKDIDWWAGLKSKTWQIDVYKKCISPTKSNISLGWKDGKRFSKQMGHRKQAGEAILFSDKVDFKLKLVRRHKEGHFILIKETIHQDQITIIKLICAQCWCTQLH
jgi:hypothetical protein